MENNFFTEDEALAKLQNYKDMIDNAYDTTKNKYGEEHAKMAILNYFTNSYYENFTSGNNARSNMQKFMSRPYETLQIILDYAISSFIANNMVCNLSQTDLYAYANDKDYTLNYEPKHITKIVAIATAFNPYWTYNLLSCNHKVIEALLENFVTERYILNEREKLDNCKPTKIIKFTDYPNKPIFMSKARLARDIDNMNRDDEISEDTNEYIYDTMRGHSK